MIKICKKINKYIDKEIGKWYGDIEIKKRFAQNEIGYKWKLVQK